MGAYSRLGVYSRWALIRGWALIQINTVIPNLHSYISILPTIRAVIKR